MVARVICDLRTLKSRGQSLHVFLITMINELIPKCKLTVKRNIKIGNRFSQSDKSRVRLLKVLM